MRLNRYAIIGMFVTTALIFIAAAMPARPAVIDTANFTNDSDRPVLIQIRKVSGIGHETLCLDPGNSDSFHFIQKVKHVSFFFSAGEACRYPPRSTTHSYSFYEPETTYTIRGKYGHYWASVRH